MVVAPHPGPYPRRRGVGNYSPSWADPSSWYALRTTWKLGVEVELLDALDLAVIEEVAFVVELSADEVWEEVS